MTSLCQDRGIPIVLFNRYIPGSEASGVRCDNVAGGRLIAEAFLAAGARSFAMITGDPRGTTSQDRVRGFVEGLLEGGIKREATSRRRRRPVLLRRRGRRRALDFRAATGERRRRAVRCQRHHGDGRDGRVSRPLRRADTRGSAGRRLRQHSRGRPRALSADDRASAHRGHGRADARPYAPRRTRKNRSRAASTCRCRRAWSGRDDAEAAGLRRHRGRPTPARADPAYSAASRTGGS